MKLALDGPCSEQVLIKWPGFGLAQEAKRRTCSEFLDLGHLVLVALFNFSGICKQAVQTLAGH